MEFLRSCATALALLVGCGRTAARPVEATPAPQQAQAEAPGPEAPAPALTDLSAHPFPLLIWSAHEVERDYFDKGRFDPKAQVIAAAEALGLHTPEFFAEAKGDALTIRVRASTAEFRLDDLTSPMAAAMRIEQVLGFAHRILDLDDPALHELEYVAINGLFAPLDPHTILLTPEQHTDLGVRTKGEFGGVGAHIRPEARRILIVSVLPDMPAALAGLQGGDLVLTIDGESTVNMTAEEAQQKLRGPVGSQVSVSVQRGKKTLRVEVTRDTIRIASVRKAELPQSVVYLDVSAFQEDTAQEVRTALASAPDLQALVLDLRGNSGGILTQATEMIDDLVAQGDLVIVRSAAGEEVAAAKPATVLPARVPVVVLIDEESASAAEIVSGGLQALGRAVVLGRNSFGKGTVQIVRPAAPYGQELALKLTLAEWLVAGGRHIQSTGVQPDLALYPVEASGVPGVLRFYDVERFERSRERSRVAHLPSARHERLRVPLAPVAAQVRYLATRELPASMARDGQAPAELHDPEIRVAYEVARALVDRGTHGGPGAVLRAAAERIGAQEDDRIVAALAAAKIDWSASPVTAAPKLQVSASLFDRKDLQAGKPFGLRISVENLGDQPVHRVHAITDCVHDELDGIELFVGKIAPGAKVTREVQLHVMPWHPDFTDALAVRVHAGEPDEKPDAETRVMFDVVGATRPTLAYDYWIIDDPTLAAVAPARPVPEDGSQPTPFRLSGNGDGLLQPGERVLLAFVAHNRGPGESPGVRALLHNLSGRQGLLEEGFYDLGALGRGAAKAGAFAITVSDTADPSVPLELEFMIGDVRLRTSVQDRLRFRVFPQSPALRPDATRIEVREEVRLYGGAHPSAPVLAVAPAGAQLEAIGQIGAFSVVKGARRDQRWFLPADLDTVVPGPSRTSPVIAARPRTPVLPPTLELQPHPRITTATTVEVRGAAVHAERLRDVAVLVRPPGAAQVDHKVLYRAHEGNAPVGPQRLDFAATVPLEPGSNRITVLARDGAKVIQRQDLWVYREVP